MEGPGQLLRRNGNLLNCKILLAVPSEFFSSWLPLCFKQAEEDIDFCEDLNKEDSTNDSEGDEHTEEDDHTEASEHSGEGEQLDDLEMVSRMT